MIYRYLSTSIFKRDRPSRRISVLNHRFDRASSDRCTDLGVRNISYLQRSRHLLHIGPLAKSIATKTKEGEKKTREISENLHKTLGTWPGADRSR